MKALRRTRAAAANAVLLLAAVAGDIAPARGQTEQAAGKKLEPKADDQAGVRVEVVPRLLHEGRPIVFEVYFNTHSVHLDFDVQAIAALEDAAGVRHRPTAWEGSPPGGHHRSGHLIFPALNEFGYLKLMLEGVAGVDRVFEWRERPP